MFRTADRSSQPRPSAWSICRMAALAVVLSIPWPSARLSAAEDPAGAPSIVVPEGFELVRAAAGPLVRRPLMATFDERGGLYLVDSAEDVEQAGAREGDTRRYRIDRLNDENGDGVFDSRSVYSELWDFPGGLTWIDGSLYVASSSTIWKMTDRDGDGVAESRAEWLPAAVAGGRGFRLRGPFAGIDGRIYWARVLSAASNADASTSSTDSPASGNSQIFRARQDGSDVERVLTLEGSYPVAVAFTAAGERIVASVFLDGSGGAVFHAIDGGRWAQDDLKSALQRPGRTDADPLPSFLRTRSAAPVALLSTRRAGIGETDGATLFACYPGLHNVSRLALFASGSSFAMSDEAFVTAGDRNFFPRQVLQDADGSLVLIDSGAAGGYGPTARARSAEASGGVYRLRDARNPALPDPRGLLIEWTRLGPKDIADLLCDRRTAVQDRAVAVLGKGGPGVIPSIADVGLRCRSADGRLGAVWASARIDAPEARVVARAALSDADEVVRQAGAHVAGLVRDRGAVPQLVLLLEGESPHDRLAAAEALGRIGDVAASEPLRRALEATAAGDRFLRHALIHALAQVGRPGPAD